MYYFNTVIPSDLRVFANSSCLSTVLEQLESYPKKKVRGVLTILNSSDTLPPKSYIEFTNLMWLKEELKDVKEENVQQIWIYDIGFFTR